MLPIGDTIPARNPPVGTWLLILANSVVFLFELMMPQPSLEQLFHLFGIVPARYTHPDWALSAGLPLGDYWPFLTSMFLHGGWLHIIGNMWTLWIFGDNVEDRLGPVRYLGFYILCGLAAGAMHLATVIGGVHLGILHSADLNMPTIGASGAIAGVMGAYMVTYPRARVLTLVPILFFIEFVNLPAWLFLGIWFLLQFFSGSFGLLAGSQGFGGVAWWAHV